MNPALSGMNLWLMGIVILLCGITIVEGGIILHMKRSSSANPRGLLQKLLPSRWVPVTSPKDRQIAKDDRIVLWESAQDLEAIHDQINRLFSNLPGPGSSALPPFAGAPGLRPSHPSSMDRFFQLQQEIERIFEDAFNDVDVFSLPGRLDQGWAMSGVSSSMHIEEQGSNYVVQVAMPGLDASAIAINLEGRLLTISVNQNLNRPTKDADHRVTGAVSHREHMETKVMLPGPVDTAAAQATYHDGILRIEIPKSPEKEPLARTIKVI